MNIKEEGVKLIKDNKNYVCTSYNLYNQITFLYVKKLSSMKVSVTSM